MRASSLLWAALALAACVAEPGQNPTSPNPHSPGGTGGTGGTGGPDAGSSSGSDGGSGGGTADAGAAGRVRGRLCALTDVRASRTCVPLTGSGLSVRVRETGAEVAAGADGRFDLPGRPGTPLTLVSSANSTYFASAVTVPVSDSGAGSGDLQVLTRDDVARLVTENLAFVPEGTGILVVRVDAQGQATAGAELATIGAAPPHYDADDPLLLSGDPPTRNAGTAVYFGLLGLVSYKVTLGTHEATFESFITPDAVNFADVSF